MKHLKVMVVDDTSVSRMLIVDALNQIGLVNVAIAKDGEEALRVLMSSLPHLVLSDFNMPKLNGLQLLRSLREFAPTRQVGFILVTGRGERELIEQGRALGLNNYLPKPFTVTSVRNAIEAVVGKLM